MCECFTIMNKHKMKLKTLLGPKEQQKPVHRMILFLSFSYEIMEGVCLK